MKICDTNFSISYVVEYNVKPCVSWKGVQLPFTLSQHTNSAENCPFTFLLQVWSLPILQPLNPCRAPSWGSSSFSLESAPLLARGCWLLSPSKRLAGCHHTKTLVRERGSITLYYAVRQTKRQFSTTYISHYQWIKYQLQCNSTFEWILTRKWPVTLSLLC